MNDRIILGVAGGSGSGKTTVVEEILRGLHPGLVYDFPTHTRNQVAIDLLVSRLRLVGA